VGLFGGYPIARNIHLAIMFLIVAFMIVHVVLVAIFARALVSMIVGTPAEPKCRK
jgi:thiosulfate reductase cytochrome b subunit